MTRQKPRPSPSAWLWAELARRYGDEAANEMHDAYNEQFRAYKHAIWHSPESPWQPRAKPPPPKKRGT